MITDFPPRCRAMITIPAQLVPIRSGVYLFSASPALDQAQIRDFFYDPERETLNYVLEGADLPRCAVGQEPLHLDVIVTEASPYLSDEGLRHALKNPKVREELTRLATRILRLGAEELAK